jgi:hypothetical protein
LKRLLLTCNGISNKLAFEYVKWKSWSFNWQKLKAIYKPMVREIALSNQRAPLPPHLERIWFAPGFNESLRNNYYPDSVQVIVFSPEYNANIGQLPPRLTTLIFPCDKNQRSSFNQPLPVLPPTLRILRLSKCFNQSVVRFCSDQQHYESILPNSLTALDFGHFFNQPFYNTSLPTSLNCLRMGYYFNHPLPILPSCLKTILLSSQFNQPFSPIPLPTALTCLVTGSHFNHALPILPDGLKILRLGYCFNTVVDNLPSSLTCLQFGYSFNKRILFCLPPHLTDLLFGDSFNQPLVLNDGQQCILPDSIQTLQFGFDFAQPVCFLPSSLKVLRLASYNNYLGPWPHSLTRLELGIGFDWTMLDTSNIAFDVVCRGEKIWPRRFSLRIKSQSGNASFR